MKASESELEWWRYHGYGNIEQVLQYLANKPFVVLHTDGEMVTVIERRSSRMAAECLADNIGNAAWVEWDPEHCWQSGTTTG